MKKDRFHGGRLSNTEKEEWKKQAHQDGFDRLWQWIKFLARTHIKKGMSDAN